MKDASVLCTLANFDVYIVTRVHKSPKPFIFSVKSAQNMRMFENLSDYHHVFSCDATEGAQWLHNILLARVSHVCFTRILPVLIDIRPVLHSPPGTCCAVPFVESSPCNC